MKKLALASAVSGAMLAPLAFADGHKFEISAGAAFQKFDSDRKLDDETGYGVGLGYVINPRWTVEAWWTEIDSELENNGGDVDTESARLDFLYHLENTWGAWQPFLIGGLGDVEFDVDNGSTTDETRWNLGVGVKRELSEHFDFRTDLRWFDSMDENEQDLGLLLALTYKLGKTAAPAAPEPAPQRLDSDGDGVYDDEDKCPGTAANLAVDADGCPMKLMEDVSVGLKLYFDNDSAVVKEAYYSEIKRVADFMETYSNTKVEIQGHTDSRGSAAYNKNLSQRRADAVAKVLVEKFGVEAGRVSAKGYGEDMPIASNEAIEGRAANRRVIAEISAQVETMKQR
ncbi:MAG: OmpA family protein [Candidatus Pelagadaptatus aseana]